MTITATVDVEVEPEDVLPHLSTEDLLEELQTRTRDAVDVRLKTLIRGLQQDGCPDALMRPINRWYEGHLSLTELMEIESLTCQHSTRNV